MPKQTPYFTYEVGTDEPPHPDRDIAQRFVEVAMSDCRYGCKIYADPFSEVRVLVHSAVYGCRTTMAKLEEARKDGHIRPGDKVEFTDRNDPMLNHTGTVLSKMETATGEEMYRVGCYFLVQLRELRAVEPAETYQQAYDRLVATDTLTMGQFAAYLGISLEALQNLKLRDRVALYDGTEFKAGDWVKFRDFENPDTYHTGQIIRYVSPHLEEDDLLEETFGGYHIRTTTRHPVSGMPMERMVYGKGALEPLDQ